MQYAYYKMNIEWMTKMQINQMKQSLKSMSNYCVLHVTYNNKNRFQMEQREHITHFKTFWKMENGEALLNLHAEFIGTFHFKYCDIKALSL